MFRHLQKDFLYEYAKGGGGYTPPPDYKAQAEADVLRQNNQAAIDRENAARAKAEADAKHAQDVAASQGRVGSAYNSALNYGNTQLAARGLDASSGYGSQLMNLYRSALDSARSNAPEIVSDASSLFGPSLYDTAYNTVRGTARQGLNKQLNGFLGNGFETQTFADNADDDILSSILGDQKKDTLGKIESAKARGQINDVGYSRALKDTDTAFDAGLAKANQIGLGVLSNYRKDLTDFANNQHNAVDNYDLGDTYDVNGVHSQFDNLVGSKKNSLRGDILAAIGGQSFFDDDKILGLATGASGVQNNSGSPSSVSSPLIGNANALTAPYNTQTGSNSTDNQKKNQAF